MDNYDRKKIMDEECKVAKSVDLVYLAKQLGFTPYKSGSLHRMKEDETLVVYSSTNTFCHYYYCGTKGYGGSPIDFAMTYGNMTMPEAISYLLDLANYKRENVINTNINYGKIKKEQKLVLPESNDNHKRVFAYLNTTRRINGGVISQFMHDKRLYESRDKHNCVFVTYDIEGNPKYASLRGTLTYGSNTTFRGDVIGSDKKVGFPYVREYSDTVFVFESPIDLMSFMSLYPEDGCHYLALGGLSLNSLDTFLEEHPEIENIGFILDNDSRAPEIVTTAKIQYAAYGYNIVEHELVELLRKENVKDVNEYLVKLKNKPNIPVKPMKI